MKLAHIVPAFMALFLGLQSQAQATVTASPSPTASATPTATPGPLAPLNLGEACGFAVLAGAAFTNTGTTTITGNVGAQTESIPGVTLIGTNQQYNVLTTSALKSLGDTYTNAMGLAPSAVILGNDLSTDATNGVTGTIEPGLYSFAGAVTSDNTTTLTLDALGNTSAVFIFLASSSLNTGTDFTVTLTNGAQAQNVFWVVASAATLGTRTNFVGTLIANDAITLNTGANINGGVLSNGGSTNGSITIDGGSNITDVTCPNPAVTPSPSPTRTSLVTATSTFTPSPSSTDTFHETATATFTPSPSSTNTPLETATPTFTPSPSSTDTTFETATASPTVSATFYPSPTIGGASLTPIPLGSAANFSILAGTEITNTGASSTNGYIGVYPGTGVTGPGTLTGQCTDYTGNGTVMLAAKTDLTDAYNNAQGLTPTDIIGATNIGGFTLPAGVYESASNILLDGTLTLDGNGDPNAVFVFQAVSSLTVAVGSQVILENGAQAKNVFWAVGSSATIDSSAKFVGTVLAYTSITVGTGATVDGNLLAINGDVTLDANAITTITTFPPGGCTDFTATPSPSASPTFNRSLTATRSPSASPTVTRSLTATPSPSASPTVNRSLTATTSPSASPTVNQSLTKTPSPSVSPTVNLSLSASPSATPVPAGTKTNTPGPAGTFSAVPTSTLPDAPHSYFYPSPARGSKGSIAFNMKDRGSMTMHIYNQAGTLVDTVSEDEGQGRQSANVSVGKFASGIYFYVLSMRYASGSTETDPPRGFVVLH